MSNPLFDAVESIRAWGEARDWRGYDPYDGLNSPAADVLSLGTPLGRRLLTQAVKLSPANLRPALGIKPAWNAKALGLVCSAYARLWAAGGDDSAREELRGRLAWLEANGSVPGPGTAWGYHFDVQTRVLAYGARTPNTIATSFVAQGFLDAHEHAAEADALAPARQAARFLVDNMLVSRSGGDYFSYLPGATELVHNANLLACAVLARLSRLAGDPSLLEPALAALDTSLAAQRQDGSWPYAEQAGHDWVDNFHTAYVLEALAECARSLPELREPLQRGADYWQRELFLADGVPKYSPHRAPPEDAHCYASAIDAWVALAHWRPDALERAERLAGLLMERMLDPTGYVRFQRRRMWTNKVPFVRWTTAPSFKALAGLLMQRAAPAGRRTGTATPDRA